MRELVPRLAAKVAAINAGGGQRLNGERVDPSARRATRAVGFDIAAQTACQMVEHPLGQHAADGVMRAQNQSLYEK